MSKILNTNETCAWTPKQSFLAIIVMESQGLPTMKCQAKCAKAIWLDPLYWDGRLARATRPTGRRPAILDFRLLAVELGKSRQVQASLGKWAGNQQSWNPGYWQLS